MSQEVAEQSVLGACLVSDKAMAYAYHHVQLDHFLDKRHRACFEAFKRLYQNGIGIDLVTLEGHLSAKERKQIDLKYLTQLIDTVPTAVNIAHYHDLMRTGAIRTQLDVCYQKLKDDAFDTDVQKAVRGLWDQLQTKGDAIMPLSQAVDRYKNTIEARKNHKSLVVNTHYEELEKLTTGFHAGNLVVLGARTSIGKTSFLLNLIIPFLRQNHRLLFISAEMTWDELLDRIVAVNSDFTVTQLRRGILDKTHISDLHETLDKYKDLPLWCIEGGRMSMSRLRLAIELVNPVVVFVDFIQRFTPPNPAMNRAAFFSDFANELKAIAMERKLVMIAASQLSRDIEKREDTQPLLSDFKESGGIEESADLALVLKAEPSDDISPTKEVTAYILKNRNGPCGKLKFLFQKGHTKFQEQPQ